MLVDSKKLNNKLDEMMSGIDKDCLEYIESGNANDVVVLQGVKAILSALKDSVLDGKYAPDE